jgi:hypothetical protein
MKRRKLMILLAILLMATLSSALNLGLSDMAVHALCVTPTEAGNWVNYDSNTRSITRINVRFQCQDQVLNGRPYPPGDPFYLHLYGACHPTDCDWGERGARQDSNGWIRTTINHGFATRYVWVKAYRQNSKDWLRVYIWTDFVDPARQDYASDEWFVRR